MTTERIVIQRWCLRYPPDHGHNSGLWVGLDSTSGGYPYGIGRYGSDDTSILEANRWLTEEDAYFYASMFPEDCFEVWRLDAVLLTEEANKTEASKTSGPSDI